nr:MAG TPA: hypothetical protein [Caudoviricetes sp.]
MKGKIEILLKENKDEISIEVNVDAESKATDPVQVAIEKSLIVKALMHGLEFDDNDYVSLAVSMAANAWPDDREYPGVERLPLAATIAQVLLGGL